MYAPQARAAAQAQAEAHDAQKGKHFTRLAKSDGGVADKRSNIMGRGRGGGRGHGRGRGVSSGGRGATPGPGIAVAISTGRTQAGAHEPDEIEEREDADGNTAFYNRRTQAWGWTREEVQENTPEPTCWEQLVDEASGQPYYWNSATGETSWYAPGAQQEAAPQLLHCRVELVGDSQPSGEDSWENPVHVTARV